MSDPRFQTLSEIRAMLGEAGLRPRKRLGQHFLIDGNLMRRLFTSAEVRNDDVVLEVGAGTGSLTEVLAVSAGRVVAVEADGALCTLLRGRLADRPNVALIQADALASKHRIAPEVIDALADAHRAVGGRLMLVANLPYNIATPLLLDLLLLPITFERFCFTVQREVADRLIAAPCTKDFGPIGIAVQSTCRIERLADLSPNVFWPRPAVDSTMLRIDVERHPFETTQRQRRFAEFVRSAFAHRRKTMRHNLSTAVGVGVAEALASDFDLGKRPQAFGVDEWITIGKRVEVLLGA